MSSHSADSERGPDPRPDPSLHPSLHLHPAPTHSPASVHPHFDTASGTRPGDLADADADADADTDAPGAANPFAEPQAEREPQSPDAARASLRAMWQLPAAWRVLQLLTVPLASAPPPARVFEDALVDPIAHMSAVADMHGRLLGHGLGRACMDKWMGSACRFFREFPGTFRAVLGDNGGDVRVFRDWEDYARLDARTRLLCLYAMAEMVICEHDTLLKVTAGLAEVGHEEMRLEAVGFDAVGNAYWYFGDEDRLYREPGKRKARAKGRAEVNVEGAASRSPARSTRALGEKEEDLLNGGGGRVVKDEEVLEDEGEMPRKKKSRRRSTPAAADVANPVERRSSSRKRNPPPPMLTADASPKRAKRPRRNSLVEPQHFADAHLRRCDAWELVCEGAEELDAFVARFGPCADITNARETFLVRRLQEELLPILQEIHVKAKRVEEKRRQVEYNATNQKKSSRVEAMEKRKKEEDEAAARKEEEEAVLEREREARRLMVDERVKSIERELAREIRATRGDVAKSNGGTAAFASDAPRISRAHPGRVRSLRRRGVDPDGDDASDEKAVLGGGDENAVGSGEGNRAKSASSAPESVTSAGVGGDGETAKTEEAVGELRKTEGREGSFEKEGEHVAMAEAKAETEAEAKEHTPVASILSAITEASLPDELTWQHLPDDVIPDRLLPARFLTRFVLFRRDDMTHAALEDVLVDSVSAEGEDTKPDIMGFGIVVPPDGSESDPVCVELGRVVEWQIEYIRDDSILWLKTELAWYQLETTEPLPEYVSSFSSGRSKFEICVRLSILGGLMKSNQLTYEDACGLLAQRYLNMRANKEADILESSAFITEQLAMMKKQSLLKSGFYLALKKRESDLRRVAKRAAEKEQHEVELVESRKRKRESDKKREEEHAEKLAADKLEKAAKAKVKRERSSSVGRRSASPLPRYHPPYRPTFHPPLAVAVFSSGSVNGATSPAVVASLPPVPGVGLSGVADGSSERTGGDDLNVRSSAAPLALSGSLDGRSASIVAAGDSPFVPQPRPVSPVEQDLPEPSAVAVSVVARQMQSGLEEPNSASHTLDDVQVPNCDWGGRYSSSAQDFDRSNVTAPAKFGTPQAPTAPLAASNGSLNCSGETFATGSASHPQTDHAPVYVSSPNPGHSILGVGEGNDLSAGVGNVRSPRYILPSPPAVEPRSEPEGRAASVAISSAHLPAEPAVAPVVLQMGAADSLVGYSAKENGTAANPAGPLSNGRLSGAPIVSDADVQVGAADSQVGTSAKENGVDADLPDAFSNGRLSAAPTVGDADLQVDVADPSVGFGTRESGTAGVNGLAPAGSE